MKKKLLILLGLAAIFVACKKEVTTPNGGIYRGAFREYGPSGDTLASGICHLAVFEGSNQFSMQADSLTNAPASHSGTYAIESGTIISWTNNTPVNSQFDSDHYLDTLYNYTFDDVNFKFWQVIAGKTYEYDLVRD